MNCEAIELYGMYPYVDAQPCGRNAEGSRGTDCGHCGARICWSCAEPCGCGENFCSNNCLDDHWKTPTPNCAPGPNVQRAELARLYLRDMDDFVDVILATGERFA